MPFAFRVSDDPFRTLAYRTEPDYGQPLTGPSPEILERIRKRLEFLYGAERAGSLASQVARLVKVHDAHSTPELRAAEAGFAPGSRFSEKDAILITYGDLLVAEGRSPLRTLADFSLVLFRDLVSTVHVLPFFPYSSDRGFSIISYEEVDPRLGSWEEIALLGRRFRLMFDGVFNHVSSKSRRFQSFLAGDPDYEDFFRVYSRREAISPEHRRLILRPRTSDLLSEYATVAGSRWLWTTFSSDQIDLNFRNPRVLLTVIELLLYYVRRGADLVRLDAVTYLWHELGTACANLDATHTIVKLLRDVLDAAAPHVTLVTETNVPHADNITYFGDGGDEAQMVYNFALPPLVLQAFQTGSAEFLSRWAAAIDPPADGTCFFNFLDSHDGIGLNGARGILPDHALHAMVRRVLENGGLVSTKDNGDGTESPYELNVTWWSALNDDDPAEPLAVKVDRFIASRAVALSLRGVPGIYLPSFFGSRNDLEAVRREGMKRSINRPTLREDWLLEQFGNPSSLPSAIAMRLVHLLDRRGREPAFSPVAGQRVLDLDPRLFALVRTAAVGGVPVLCVVNVSGVEVPVRGTRASVGLPPGPLVELVTGTVIPTAEEPVERSLGPYQVAWLRPA